jgi:hypothetical protein
VSGLATTNGQKDLEVGDLVKEVITMELLGSSEVGFGCVFQKDQEPELSVSPEFATQDATVLGDRKRSELATFRVTRAGKLQFRWRVKGPEDRPTERQRLRDCILRIDSKNKNTLYIILREWPSQPLDVHRFKGQVSTERDNESTTYISKWDAERVYQDRLPILTLEDCVMLNRDDGQVARLQSGGENVRVVRTANSWRWDFRGEPLLFVELGRVDIIQSRESLSIMPAPPAPSPLEVKGKSASPPSPRPRPQADVASVVVVKLSDNEPEKLQGRIGQLKQEKRELEKSQAKLKEGDKEERIDIAKRIQETQRRIERLQILLNLHNSLSLLDLKICWKIKDINLEIARLVPEKRIQQHRPPGH